MCNMLVYLFWIIVEDVSGQSIGSQLQQEPFDETDANWKAETAECQDQHRYPPWGGIKLHRNWFATAVRNDA